MKDYFYCTQCKKKEYGYSKRNHTIPGKIKTYGLCAECYLKNKRGQNGRNK